MTNKRAAIDQKMASHYTLTQAAQVLEVDAKTLQRRIAIAGIVPIRAPGDARARLLSEDQLEELRSVLDRTSRFPRAEMPMGESQRMLRFLGQRVTRLETIVQAREEENDRLSAELRTRMEQVDSMARLLVEVAQRISPKKEVESEAPSGQNGFLGRQP